jgi:hypothetical protein
MDTEESAINQKLFSEENTDEKQLSKKAPKKKCVRKLRCSILISLEEEVITKSFF